MLNRNKNMKNQNGNVTLETTLWGLLLTLCPLLPPKDTLVANSQIFTADAILATGDCFGQGIDFAVLDRGLILAIIILDFSILDFLKGSFRVKWSSGRAGTISDLAHSVIFAFFSIEIV